MRANCGAIAIVLLGHLIVFSQSVSPLGEVLHPRKAITLTDRKLLPTRAVIRSSVAIGPLPQQVTAVVYDLAPNPPEYRPHIAIIEQGQLAASFSLEKLDEYGSGYIFTEGRSLNMSDETPGFVAAFRGAGDGSGCLFTVLVKSAGHWHVAFLRRESQAQLRVLQGGRMLKLLAALVVDSAECTWCRHRYEEEVFKLDDSSARYRLTGKVKQPRRLDPYDVVKQILVFPK